jgi:hypothetical protein
MDAGKLMDSQILCGVMAKQKAPDARLAKAFGMRRTCEVRRSDV